ncbi:MAG TPA: hypothetical protein VGQ83_40125 [Polyangia bacterium]|jgi:hypothetical protein
MRPRETSILYLRPGHIGARFVLDVVAAVESLELDVNPPFVVVAERKDQGVRVRVRQV